MSVHPDEEDDPFEPYGSFDEPDSEDESIRLHFEELHPLVRDAAREGWERGDFGQALKDSWHALRDELRTRLGDNYADTTGLVESIGETGNPRLPLTDFITATDQNMHRGLVLLLKGCVFYIRHPEMHESTSPVAEDREGAFERLALLSLCARHVANAASPTALEEVIAEIKQPRFVKKRTVYDELLLRVPSRRYSEFAGMLLDEARTSYLDGDQAWVGLTEMCRHLVAAQPSTLATAAAAVGRLVADDATLEIGCHACRRPVFEALPPRHRLKVAAYLIDEVRAQAGASIDDSGAGPILVALFPAFDQSSRDDAAQLAQDDLRAEETIRHIRGWNLSVRVGAHMTDEQQHDVAILIARWFRDEPDAAFSRAASGRLASLPEGIRAEVEVELEAPSPADLDIPF